MPDASGFKFEGTPGPWSCVRRAKIEQPLEVVAMANVPHGELMARLFDTASMKCTICGALYGKCDCWTKCACGWLFRKGESCSNPIHPPKRKAQTSREIIAETAHEHRHALKRLAKK